MTASDEAHRIGRGGPGELGTRVVHAPPPAVDAAVVGRWARERFGLDGTVGDLASYIDRNALVRGADGAAWVVKVANSDEDHDVVAFQNAVLDRLAQAAPGVAPAPVPTIAGDGATIDVVTAPDGREHLLRALTFLPGTLLADATTGPATWRSLGALLGRIDAALEGFEHPAMRRTLRWDLAHAHWIVGRSASFAPADRQELVERVQLQFLGDVRRRLAELPHGVIYNDANDHNLVTAIGGGGGGDHVVGAFDFGDAVYSARVFELAVAGAYAVFDAADPLTVLDELVAGYAEHVALTDAECDVLFPSLCMRLAVSVTVSAQDAAAAPDNDYIRVSEAQAWRALEHLAAFEPAAVAVRIAAAAGRIRPVATWLPRTAVESARRERLGPSLSLSYAEPLEIVRGRAQFLFDKTGRAYLDGVNNVCHVGHCHPRVVAAATEQIATLNTNTRYLHDHIVRYAERLAGLFPAPLEVCYFVNSGSEANELALRLARAATGRHDVVALEHGYHGHTTTLIDVSHYKHGGRGGAGTPDGVHLVPCPDPYRGRYRGEPDEAERYAAHVPDAIAAARAQGRDVAAFLHESLIGCGGQVVPPPGFLTAAYAHARAAGVVCIADEVQTGFGRVGSHRWSFELDGVTPDIVTVGKPIGNGHPLAAVITTRAIADAFANGMEYFNTFGGNPVSCAIGLAVLDVLEDERLQEHAADVGERLLAGFRALAERYACIGDVRGVGLYLGVEFVRDRATREPAADVLARVLDVARDTGVLLSSDGPDHNVLKIKPPLPFDAVDADLLLRVVDRALAQRDGS